MPRDAYEMTETLLSQEQQREFKEYDFDFENLALEGGGSAALAYVGVIRVLEELGYLKKIKRFAGSSAGGIIATYLAIGYTPLEIQKLFRRDFTPILYDGCCCCGWIVNLVRRFGAHPGKKLQTWIARNIKEKTGDKNYTFRQLYEEKHVELCILATDLSKMDTVYFHIKTTPDMPIYLAARASSSIPGILKPVKWNKSIFVDGGVLCNYPLHVYDGWYLSMKEGDQFLKRFSDLAKVSEKWTNAERFGTVNEKTLGVMVFSASDPVLMKDHMQKRADQHMKGKVERPSTKLSRKRYKKEAANTKEVKKMTSALERLMTMLDRADIDENHGTVSRQEFRDFYKQNGDVLTQEDIKLLFGTVRKSSIANAIFDRIDTNKNKTIEYKEIAGLAEQRGVNLAQTIRGYEDRKISDVKEFFSALVETLMIQAQRVTAKTSDCSRTIGINAGYLGTFDWSMQNGDKDYLIECGKQAALYFLRERKHGGTCVYPSLE